MTARTILALTGLMAALAFGAINAVRVAAHNVEPVSSTPAVGEKLAESPSEVVLVFPEEAKEKGSSLQVVDASGKPVDSGNGGVDLNDPKHVTLRVKLPKLAEGVYLVKWTIALTDGDSASGTYHFGVGNVTVPTEEPEATETVAADPAPGPVAAAGKGLLLWVGGAIAGIVVVAAAVYFSRRRSRE